MKAMSGKRIRQSILIVLFLVLPALFLRARAKDPMHLNVVDRAMLRMVSPIQRGCFHVGWTLRQWFRNYFFLVGVNQKNQKLRQDNDDLQLQILSMSHCKPMTVVSPSSSEQGGIKQPDSIRAAVIGYDTLPFPSRTLFLQFSVPPENVKPGMPVVGPDGVVGRIASVYGSQAKVQTMADPQFAVAVRVSRSKKPGVLKGSGMGKPMRLEYIETNTGVQINDAVVTAGIGSPDGVPLFPAGLLLGKVTSVENAPSGLSLKIDVEPQAKLDEIREVWILINTPTVLDPKPSKINKERP